MPQQPLTEVIEELARRSTHALYTYTPGSTPGWDQLSFHRATDRYRMAFGGNQSGKSKIAAHEIYWWLSGTHPHRPTPTPPVLVWAISAEYTTIQAGVYRHLKEIIPEWEIEKIGPNVPQQDLPAFIRLKNGSQVSFKTAQGDARKKFQAAECHLISIDEEVDATIWTELQARTMATGGQFIISATLVESYDWIVKLESRALKGYKDHFLVRLESTQNPHLDADTIVHLQEDWSDEEKEVRIHGKSRRSVGLVYNNWDDSLHQVKPFKIPLEWPRWCAIDPGLRVFAALWVCVDPKNQAYAYRELYINNSLLAATARAIKELEGWKLNEVDTREFYHYVWDRTEFSEDMVIRVIDDKRGSRLITGEKGVRDQLYERYGINSIPAEKSLRPGIEACRQWLMPHHADGPPVFRVFNTCTNFLEERRRYRIRTKMARRDSNAPIDEPIRANNHLMDCWRYIAVMNPRWEDKDPTESPHYMYTHAALAERIRRKHEEESYHEFCGAV